MSESGSAGRYARLEHEAYERHVLELARGYAAEQERIAAAKGDPRDQNVKEVELEGEYPDTRLAFRVYEPRRSREYWTQYPIWDEMFRTTSGHMHQPERVAGDILMWVRGG